MTVGRRAVIAAGTTVVRDVPAGSLGIARAEQVAVSGYAQKLADRYADRASKNGKAATKGATKTPGKAGAKAKPGRTRTKAKGATATR